MKTIVPYAGGARLIQQTLLTRLPEHSCYVEVFAGSARLLFVKPPEVSGVEVINDIDDDLVNLFSVVKNSKQFRAFTRGLDWLLTSRTQFERFRRLDTANLAPVDQALRTFYLLRAGFGGKLASPSFSYSAKRKSGLDIDAAKRSLSGIHNRLSRVYIENLDFEDCIRKYDRPGTFFYCAPSHYGLRMHRHNLSENDHHRLHRVLGRVKGKFLLTYNEVPEILKLYRRYAVQRIAVRYPIGIKGAGQWKRSRLLLISNYTSTEVGLVNSTGTSLVSWSGGKEGRERKDWREWPSP